MDTFMIRTMWAGGHKASITGTLTVWLPVSVGGPNPFDAHMRVGAALNGVTREFDDELKAARERRREIEVKRAGGLLNPSRVIECAGLSEDTALPALLRDAQTATGSIAKLTTLNPSIQHAFCFEVATGHGVRAYTMLLDWATGQTVHALLYELINEDRLSVKDYVKMLASARR